MSRRSARTLRHLLHFGGQITYTIKTIIVALDTPTTSKLTRALGWCSTSSTPSPEDHRPINYEIKPA